VCIPLLRYGVYLMPITIYFYNNITFVRLTKAKCELIYADNKSTVTHTIKIKWLQLLLDFREYIRSEIIRTTEFPLLKRRLEIPHSNYPFLNGRYPPSGQFYLITTLRSINAVHCTCMRIKRIHINWRKSKKP
jgi:hypothetical protein